MKTRQQFYILGRDCQNKGDCLAFAYINGNVDLNVYKAHLHLLDEMMNINISISFTI